MKIKDAVLSLIVTGPKSGCVKIRNGADEVSISFDDSCGALKEAGRVEVCIFRGECTKPEVIFLGGSLEGILRAVRAL